MTKSKLIIILGRDNLLSGALMLFLSRREEWDLIHIKHLAAFDQFIQTVDTHSTEIVVIEQAAPGQSDCLFLELLPRYPHMKVIVINSENNQVDIYRKQKLFARQAADLIDMIEQENIE